MNGNTKWTEETTRQEALKYKSRKEFSKGSSGAYAAACKNDWLKTYPWLVRVRKQWTEETVRQEALKYKTRGEFQTRSSGAYTVALKNGWLKTYPWLVPVRKQWTKEAVFHAAQNSESRTQFREDNPGAYKAAVANGWHEVFESLKVIQAQHRFGYWTDERIRQEALKYKFKKEFEKGSPKAYAAARRKHLLETFDWFESKAKPSGYWNVYENNREEALKYKTRPEFQKCSQSAYNAACRNGWLEEYYWLELSRKPRGYWNVYENNREEALKYSLVSDFQRGCPPAYSAALKNGWLKTYTWFEKSIFTNGYTLSLLKSGDLEGMSSHQLIELIASKKVPSDFKVLAYTQPNSSERKGRISDLIGIRESNKSEEEAEAEIERLENEEEKKSEEQLGQEVKDNGIFTLVTDNGTQHLGNQDVQNSTATQYSVVLPSVAMTQLRIYDNTLKMKPGDKAAEFIVKEELSKLWNSILYANDEGKADEEIERLKNMELGEFSSYVRDRFISEYDEVVSIQEDEDYRFDVDGDPCPPFLMQKLMAYKMANNKEFGNWCGTGAGKTNAFLFSTRYIKAKVTVVILPNDVINTFVGDKEHRGAIERIYPNSRIVVPSRVEDIEAYDRNQYTYVLFNYEKFQNPKTAKGFINRLLDTNTIDFVCLDEAHYIKVRNEDMASNRSKFINTLLIEGRKANPEMRTLFMTATPCPNSLSEIRSLNESLTGKEYPEIGNRTSVMNVHNAYKALLLNGFRYVPKYPIKIKERTETIDCTNDVELFEALTNNRDNDINDIELELAKRKLDVLKKELENTKDGTVVYSNWVSGMAQMLYENIKSWGYKVECYNGLSGDKEGRQEILNRFLSGKINVLVCSQPISTGVDGLQKRCNKMVLMSLPWTDDNYKQLKGRIYRQGSNFHEVEFVIPQVFITLPDGSAWSWDALRLNAIETKRSLSSAAVDGYIQDSYRINRERLKKLALKALKAGFEEVSVERKDIETGVDLNETEEELRARHKSFVSEIHRKANTCKNDTIRTWFTREVEKEYHVARRENVNTWIEDPVDRIAGLINKLPKRYNKIIDLGCGENKLKTLTNRFVQGVNFNIINDDTVIEADMAHLEGLVNDGEYDVAVFCLSLWGCGYDVFRKYLNEAYRVLNEEGHMYIVEPADSFGEEKHYGTKEEFIDFVESVGFKKLGRKVEDHYGKLYFEFSKF